MRFIYSNIKYPKEARNQGIDGIAQAKVTIEKDGSISDISMLSSLSIDIKLECERVLSLLPKWEPGYANGQPVTSHFYIPIKFRLE